MRYINLSVQQSDIKIKKELNFNQVPLTCGSVNDISCRFTFSKEWNDYLLLRDHLNADEAAAQRYADLKRESAQKYPDDRNAYTDSKSSLIAALLAQASAAD